MGVELTAESVAGVSAGLDLDKGQPLRVMPVHPHLSLAALSWKRLSSIVPDPRNAEDPAALRYAAPADREQAEMRNEVQRMINKTKKAENAESYARYIASGIRGDLETGWSTPPFALWVPDKLEHDSTAGPYGQDFVAFLPFGLKGVLVDAETQHLAHILLSESPLQYELTKAQIDSRIVAVEIYHGIPLTAARQIFHDRNLLGVIPNKTVALNSDSRDVATSIANAIMDKVIVQHPLTRRDVPLRAVVSVNKRQLGAKDPEWMTLSTLRSFVVTLIFGRAGFEMTSAAVTPDQMPARPGGGIVTHGEAEGEAMAIARVLFGSLGSYFNRRTETVIASPAVLAALGAVAYRSTSWSPEPKRNYMQLSTLLKDVAWDRDPTVWDGVAGKATVAGNLSLAGGVKDNGSKTAAALEDPQQPNYRKIRRLVY
jgi:hypothetical protein